MDGMFFSVVVVLDYIPLDPLHSYDIYRIGVESLGRNGCRLCDTTPAVAMVPPSAQGNWVEPRQPAEVALLPEGDSGSASYPVDEVHQARIT